MEDWIVLDDNKPNTVNDEINNVNNLISQLDNEINNNSYEPSCYKQTNSNFFGYITKEKKSFSSCSFLLNNLCIQIKTLQFYLLSIINNLKQNLY